MFLKVFCKSFISCFYRPKRSWGKVIFSHVSVILFTGGSLSRGVSVQGGLCPGDLCHGDPQYGNERAVRILLLCILVICLRIMTLNTASPSLCPSTNRRVKNKSNRLNQLKNQYVPSSNVPSPPHRPIGFKIRVYS